VAAADLSLRRECLRWGAADLSLAGVPEVAAAALVLPWLRGGGWGAAVVEAPAAMAAARYAVSRRPSGGERRWELSWSLELGRGARG
jgi:hypothetical protein